jgi:peroxiredoxin
MSPFPSGCHIAGGHLRWIVRFPGERVAAATLLSAGPGRGRHEIGAKFRSSFRGTVPRRAGHLRAALPPGTPAPDFALPSTLKRPVGPADFGGRPLILVFYPADWSPVCTDQLGLYQEVMPEFQRHGAELLGISVDSLWSHLAFAMDRNLHFPLLADFEPKGEVSRAYGVYRAQDGTSERALFVLDPAGVVSWSYVSPTEVNPGADGILRALEDLSMKGVAP